MNIIKLELSKTLSDYCEPQDGCLRVPVKHYNLKLLRNDSGKALHEEPFNKIIKK